MGGPGPRRPPSQQPGGGGAVREFLRRRRYAGLPPDVVAANWDEVHAGQAGHVDAGAVGLRASTQFPGAAGFYARRRYHFEVQRWATYNGFSFQSARHDPYFRHYYRILADMERRVAKGQDVDRSPGGLYARALEALNYRRPQSPWIVGETPKVRTA